MEGKWSCLFFPLLINRSFLDNLVVIKDFHG